LLIRRSWHDVLRNRLDHGKCPKCGLAIPGVWEKSQGGTVAAAKSSRTASRYEHSNL